MPKWIIISAVVILVVIMSSAVAYFIGKGAAVPTPTPITKPVMSWKTYTNTKHNYSIAYPGDWSVREYPDTKEGAAFNPNSKPGYPDNGDAISISVGQKIVNYIDDPFEEYVKIAASAEIQNYGELASIKKVTTTDGMVGYETTWMVQPFLGRGSGSSESMPITYFELPNSKTLLVRVTLGREEDLATYEQMLSTIKFSVLKNVTPTPTVDEEAVLKDVIKKYIALKHNSDENSLTVTVSKIDGDYAQGGVTDEGGGGMWFAAKENGLWHLVWDGNGVILCSDLSSYPNFPTSMIPECWDEAKQDTVVR